MKFLNILAIGNSFTEDSTRYLYQLSNAAGIPTKVVNLYIGGCSLERHWKNIENNQTAYNYQLNGLITERTVSIDEVLTEETWDYIITQQASPDSGWFDSYEPFLGLMLQHIKEKAPTAKILLQETWAYELGSSHPNFIRYNRDQQEMYDRLHTCYTKMADKYNLDMIPSGTIIQKVRSLPAFCVPAGGLSLCRDGYHMSFAYGRYLLACIWLKKLTGISLKDITYIPASPVLKNIPDSKLLNILRTTVDSCL
jgi:hypothetical protein